LTIKFEKWHFWMILLNNMYIKASVNLPGNMNEKLSRLIQETNDKNIVAGKVTKSLLASLLTTALSMIVIHMM